MHTAGLPSQDKHWRVKLRDAVRAAARAGSGNTAGFGRPSPRYPLGLLRLLRQRVRGQRSPEDGAGPKDKTEAPKKRHCTPSWARLVSKVYEADPPSAGSADAR